MHDANVVVNRPVETVVHREQHGKARRPFKIVELSGLLRIEEDRAHEPVHRGHRERIVAHVHAGDVLRLLHQQHG